MSRTPMPIVGHFPSIKMNGMVRYGSTVEADAIYYFEFMESVVAYYSQPFKTKQRLPDGTIHTYTPDYLVYWQHGEKTIVECKPEAKLQSGHTRQQIALGKAWANENDADFILLTDSEIRSGHRLSNIKLLWRYARIELPKPILWQIQELLSTCSGQITILEICNYLACGDKNPFIYRKYILHMLFHHFINFDLDTQINDDLVVWAPSEQHS